MRKGRIWILFACILFAVSVWLHATADFLNPGSTALVATLAWLGSIAAFGIYVATATARKQSDSRTGTLREVVIVGVIMAVAMALRLYKLDYQGINSDEWYWLTQARMIVGGIHLSPFGFIGDQPSNMPVYPVALMYAVTHNNYLAVRLPGVIYSLMTLLFVYGFVREATSRKAAAASLLLLATSVWDIHNSQIGLQNVFINPVLISGFMYFLYTGIRRSQPKRFFWAGVFLGLGINLLYIAALLVAAAGLVWGYMLVRKGKKAVFPVFICLAAALMVSAPTITKVLRYPTQSIARHEQFTKDNINRSEAARIPLLTYYGQQAALLFQDFRFDRYGYGIAYLWGIRVNQVVSVLAVVGAVWLLVHAYQFEALLIMSVAVVMSLPVVVLYRATSVWREYALEPAIFILAGFGFHALDVLVLKLVRIVKAVPVRRLAPYMVPVAVLAFYGPALNTDAGLYHREFLSETPQTYENTCRQITDMLVANVRPGNRVLLPDELCGGYISLFLPDNVQWTQYLDLISAGAGVSFGPGTRVVKFAPEFAMSDTQKVQSVPDFVTSLQHTDPGMRAEYVVNGDRIDAVIMIDQ